LVQKKGLCYLTLKGVGGVPNRCTPKKLRGHSRGCLERKDAFFRKGKKTFKFSNWKKKGGGLGIEVMRQTGFERDFTGS